MTNQKIDTRQFRNVLGRFASGVTVLTAEFEEKTHGMTANAFVSVSLDPPLILVSLDNRSNMHRILQQVRRFGISVLAEDQDSLSNYFAGRPVPGLQVRYVQRNRLPLIGGAVAYLVAEAFELGTEYVAEAHGDSDDQDGIEEFRRRLLRFGDRAGESPTSPGGEFEVHYGAGWFGWPRRQRSMGDFAITAWTTALGWVATAVMAVAVAAMLATS